MNLRFVPDTDSDLTRLPELVDLLDGATIAVLTGAGCSTASGIPDYRGPQTKNKDRSPILYTEFVRDPTARRRYWARSAIGWPRIRGAEPNDAHYHLAELERRGLLSGLITQNVDGLHAAAGSRRTIALHGSLAEVICLDCRTIVSRDDVQRRIERANPGWTDGLGGEIAPDGDVELPDGVPDDFRVPDCTECGGILKPNVVFFGENVAKSTVERAWQIVHSADALLVVGSSLTVYSGFRFVRGADRRGLPVGIINLGKTRGDDHATVRVPARVGEALDRLCRRL